MIAPEIRAIMRENTVIRRGGTRGKWGVRLKIDHQQFDIGYSGSKREAQWMARMLAIALERFRREKA